MKPFFKGYKYYIQFKEVCARKKRLGRLINKSTRRGNVREVKKGSLKVNLKRDEQKEQFQKRETLKA